MHNPLMSDQSRARQVLKVGDQSQVTGEKPSRPGPALPLKILTAAPPKKILPSAGTRSVLRGFRFASVTAALRSSTAPE